MNSATSTSLTVAAALTLLAAQVNGQSSPGEEPALKPPRITQAMITNGSLSLQTIRTHGLRMFATSFNKLDGYGDGPMSPTSPTTPGGRPTLQNNGTFLRVNGLDSQTCMECHSIMSAAQVPFRFGVGGVGGSNNNALGGATLIDVDDSQGNGFAAYNGRYINPPFLFGSGGVELVAKEMTTDLQALKNQARQHPGTPVNLVTKNVDFGVISYVGEAFNTSGVVGVDDDLVVRPFGRKGDFATTRAFDVGAMQFHFGMEPVEVVGRNVDHDGDGVLNEVLIGELSALHIFDTTLERPRRDLNVAGVSVGQQLFRSIGCASCHVPELQTNSARLTYSYPQVETRPSANVYYAVDLRNPPMQFQGTSGGGIRVPMFSDLKRHDLGPDLAESTGHPLDREFITARLWGIADTAPYLHDGRALTLTDAILMHGGEARSSRSRFAGLPATSRTALLTFLRSLRTPEVAAVGLNPSRI